MQHAPSGPATAPQQHALYDLLNLYAHLFSPTELLAEYRLVLAYSKRQAQFALQDLTTTIQERARA